MKLMMHVFVIQASAMMVLDVSLVRLGIIPMCALGLVTRVHRGRFQNRELSNARRVHPGLGLAHGEIGNVYQNVLLGR